MSRLWLIVFLLTPFFQGLQANLPLTQISNFSQPSVEYQFGHEIVFTVHIRPLDIVSEAYLVLEIPHIPSLVRPVPLTGETLTYRMDLTGVNLPVFSRPVYSFQLLTRDGMTIQSAPYTFAYIDNRFTWKTLVQGNFRLHWYTDNPALQQNLVRITEDGLASALDHFPGVLNTPFDIYLYPNPQPMHQALGLPPLSNVIARAIVESSVILVSNPADSFGAIPQLEQQVPHEITHLVQYQTLGDSAFSNLPMWLSEGSAVLAESYPDPADAIQLQNAVTRRTLLPISSLCQGINLTQNTQLAYAESASFVRFLQTTYGKSTMSRLTDAYKDGLSCRIGIETATGLPLAQVEETWKSDALHSPSAPFVFQNILPYLLLGLGLLFIPILSAVWVITPRSFPVTPASDVLLPGTPPGGILSSILSGVDAHKEQ